MVQRQPLLLVVGGADTGRAPITAALLRGLVKQAGHDWEVASAGVTGHDGDPAEPEARNAMLHFGHDISEHCARSLNDELVADTAVLLAVDSGTARVISMRYPDRAERITSLGELSGTGRDIPDLFRMQVGAWVMYAREIETMLQASIDRLAAMVRGEQPETVRGEQPETVRGEQPEDGAATEPAPTSNAAPPPPAAAPLPEAAESVASPEQSKRQDSINRCERLLMVLRDMPTVIDWAQARHELADELRQAGTVSLTPDDLAQSYTALLVALLEMRASSPPPELLAVLHTAFVRLYTPIDQQAITNLSSLLASWMIEK
jgi:protein-tyrosine-phosphatase